MSIFTDTVAPWLTHPAVPLIIAALFILRALIVIVRHVSIADSRLSLPPRRAAKIELLERTNVSLRDKDTALYCRIKLTDGAGHPAVNKRADLLFYKGSHRVSSSSYRGSTTCVSDKNGICEFSGIRVFEQGMVDAVIRAGETTAYLNGLDLTSIIIKRNSIPNPKDESFEKKPDRRLGFYNSKLDNILNKSMEISANKEAYRGKKSSCIALNIVSLILIAVLLVTMLKWSVILTLVVCVVDIIVFLAIISKAKSKYGEMRVNRANSDKAREELQKDIIYLYNEILYDLSIMVDDPDDIVKKPIDLQNKCSELAKAADLSEPVIIT